jgi:hypothetical protein
MLQNPRPYNLVKAIMSAGWRREGGGVSWWWSHQQFVTGTAAADAKASSSSQLWPQMSPCLCADEHLSSRFDNGSEKKPFHAPISLRGIPIRRLRSQNPALGKTTLAEKIKKWITPIPEPAIPGKKKQKESSARSKQAEERIGNREETN